MIGVGLSIPELAIRGRVSGPALDTDAATLIAAMTVPPDATRQLLISDTITAIKAAGAWTLLDELYVTAAHDVQAGKLNWINPAFAPLVATNSPAFVVDRGFTGDGTTSGLSTTGVNMSTLTKFTQDNCSLFGWSRTDGTGVGGDYGSQGATNVWAVIRSASNFMQSRMNSGTLGQSAVANAIGFFSQSRNNAANYDQLKNGVLITNVAAVTSQAPPAAPFCICRGGSNFSIRQMAGGGCGGYLTPTQWAAFYSSALLPYMTAVGA